MLGKNFSDYRLLWKQEDGTTALVELAALLQCGHGVPADRQIGASPMQLAQITNGSRSRAP